ncbi:imidazole glycerol phosphate synthase subunit HisH [Pontivivens insulae]|uniref:Imidazole glycerol phosphate synthase subunit HisH n=1 Tax=Pontivivens insulae TaxID=1639689 RepID=A0A2R8AEG7_9RHOB|nr:imidazole glycerol phosphate synthase subunit HisH [Pontivivens insulae]RED11877.1 glutamine amidotransferase [Pontivivens insulae]SPF30634.1 Imidazole glycerol phosphate synthase subunit HisH [Pontivivens insulae]
MTCVIVDYGSGNLHSAQKSFERMSREINGPRIVVSGDADVVAGAERIVLPGVGAFADCQAGLMAVDGMVDALRERVQAGTPFMGICVGMQLLATRGLEFGETSGLDWIAGDVTALRPSDETLKVPHMGWNELRLNRSHVLFEGVEQGAHAYFVHSFHMAPADEADVIATVDYGEPVTACVGRDNIVGTQFHPEKSQKTGLTVIGNFLRWAP